VKNEDFQNVERGLKRNFTFPQRCRWHLRPYGTLRNFFTNALGKSSGPIFKDQEIQEAFMLGFLKYW